MSSRHALLPLLFTSSLFLLNCSGDDAATGNAGASGTSMGAAGTTSGTAGTGGSSGSAAGTMGSAGTPAAGGSAGTGGASGSAGQGGSGGAVAGQPGSGGMPAAGSGSGGLPGGAGMGAGAAGKGGAGMSGAGGSAGTGTGGMGGGGMSGSAGAGGSGGAGAMTLTSSVITEGGMFPDQNTCATSANDSPDLTWTAGPTGTMSYAMILLDTSNSLNHWIMWDIPASITSLPPQLDDMAMSTTITGAKQKAFQGNGYTGPCPSGADHVYQFTVYALPVATLSGAMTSQQTSALAMAVMSANPLASASLSAHSTASMGGN